MRFSKKYFVFVLLLGLLSIGKLNNNSEQYATVETFRGASLQPDVFYPLMSKNINDSGTLSVWINGDEYANNDVEVKLNSSLQPVCNLRFVTDVLGGCAFRTDSSSVVVQISDNIYEFILDNPTATLNGDDLELLVAPVLDNDGLYLGLEDLCSFFGYRYGYVGESQDIIVDIEEYASLPDKFDLRDYSKVSKIRNQGSTATCWACASVEALESSLLPFADYKFSEKHMINSNSFGVDESLGGEYTMALAYLLAWQGPVEEYESDTAIHLQEAHFFNGDDIDEIKEAVFRYGGVSTSIYANVTNANMTTSSYYNKATNAYCYNGNSRPNHDVVIIGWNDNYPGSYFSQDVPGNGAFICQNSWGSGFGEDGVFYISYYDTNIGNQAVSYVRMDELGKYDYIYQSDLCGWVGQVGYNKEWTYGANVYKASCAQQIRAAGFYALDENTSYQLYFVRDYKNVNSMASRTLVAGGVLDAAGYYTIEFDSPRTVGADEEFAIVLYINTPGMTRPMAIEYAADELTANVDITDGLGYISANGLDWENVEELASANLCLKAYATELEEEKE